MRRSALILSFALVLGLILIIVLVEFGGYGQNGKPKQIPLPKGTIQQPAGVSAITPKSDKAPAFTDFDVKQYIHDHDMLFTDTPGSTILVTQVLFITSKEVNSRINRQNTGIPDNYPLCFVTLSGSFPFPGPSTVDGKPTSITYNEAYEVFDAKTGNLLMGGALGTPAGQTGGTIG